jgi:hypothetical protein
MTLQCAQPASVPEDASKASSCVAVSCKHSKVILECADKQWCCPAQEGCRCRARLRHHGLHFLGFERPKVGVPFMQGLQLPGACATQQVSPTRHSVGPNVAVPCRGNAAEARCVCGAAGFPSWVPKTQMQLVSLTSVLQLIGAAADRCCS